MSRQHWDSIYATRPADGLSWFRPHLERSLEFIAAAALPLDAPIIDVGGGTSTLVDDLLDKGYASISVLDISEAAIARTQQRLGARAAGVRWIAGDVTRVDLEGPYDFWHDRAVFHFLTDAEARSRYVERVRAAVRPGGHVLVATFGPEGPEQCSGLPVMRYTADAIHAEFGPAWRKIGAASEVHHTPFGTTQQFVYCYCRVE